MSSGQEPFLNERNDVAGAVLHILPSECAGGTQLKQTARVKDSSGPSPGCVTLGQSLSVSDLCSQL